MKHRLLSLLLVFVMVFGMLPAVHTAAAEPETVKVDFMADAKAMAQEDFWDELKSTSVSGMKVVGYDHRFGETTQTQRDAYADMRQWLAEHSNWNIDENSTKFDENWLAKRLFINAGDGDYGLRFYSGQYLNEGWASSLYLTIDAPAEGTYGFKMSVHNENGSINIDGCCGGGYGDIYINDTLVRDNYKFYASADETLTLNLGAVQLREGENTLRLDMISDKNGGSGSADRAAILRYLEFTPMSDTMELSVMESVKTVVDLTDSYLPFDAVVSEDTLSYTVANEKVVSVSLTDSGKLQLRGKSVGQTDVQIVYNGAALCTLVVTVTERSGDIPEAQPIKVDFMGDIKAMAQESFWENLKQTSAEGVKVVGHHAPTGSMTQSERAAYDEMLLWLSENTNWNVDEGQTKLKEDWLSKRLMFNAGAGDYGLRFYTGQYLNEGWASTLYLTVEAPAYGLYSFQMSVRNENGDLNIDNVCGGGFGDIYVNGELLYDNYHFRASADTTLTINLGAVELEEGKNTIAFDMISDKNGGAGSADRAAILRYLEFIPVSESMEAQVAERGKLRMDLRESLLPFDTVISEEHFAVTSSADSVAAVSITDDGMLEIRGKHAGTADVTVLQDGEELCTIAVTVLERDTSVPLETITADFMGDIRAMAQEDFWQRLKDASVSNVKVVGYHSNTDPMTDSQRQAYADMRTWLSEHSNWNIDEEKTKLLDDSAWKRVMFNAGKSDYALRFYTGMYLNSGWASSLYITVDAPVGGSYSFRMSLHNENGNVNIDNICGGGFGNIYVNEELIYENYHFRADPDETLTVNFGAVDLNEGENTVRIDILSDKNGGSGSADRAAILRNYTFVPLDDEIVPAYTKRVIDLSATYLPFDAAVSAQTHTVVCSDETLVTASIDEKGRLVLEGHIPGEAEVKILQDEEELCLIYVKVMDFDGELDDLGGNPVKADISASPMMVDIPANGAYAMKVTGSVTDGTVSVDDLVIYEGLTAQGERNLGAVQLEKGEHTITVTGAESLQSIIFEPLGTRYAERGRELYVDLNETYFAFDKTFTATASSADATIATAKIDEENLLVIEGKSLGATVVTVQADGQTLTVPVRVIPAGSLQDVTYTLDGFRAATLRHGETAVGDLTGLTTQDMPLIEKQLRQTGSVYFVSSNTAVAAVDQSTGDVTCVGEGTAVITAYANLDGVTKKASVTLTVTDDTDLASISLQAPVSYVGVGNVLQLTAQGKKASGASADMSLYPVFWSVDDESLASITQEGRLTGLAEGTVTVTAQAGVQRTALSASMQVRIVPGSELAGSDIYLDFNKDRVVSIKTATLEKDGVQINREKTYLGGEKIAHVDSNGLSMDLPVGECFVVDFVAEREGWYYLQVDGVAQLLANQNHIFLDDAYMGFIDFTDGRVGLPNNLQRTMNTIWLDAGVHTITMQAVTEGKMYLGRYILRPVPDPFDMEIAAQLEETPLLPGGSTEVLVNVTDANGRTFNLKAENKAPSYTNYFVLSSSNEAVLRASGGTVAAVGAGTAQITVTGEINGESFAHTIPVTVEQGTIAKAELTAEETTLQPTDEGVQLTLTAYGSADQTVAAPAVRYESSDNSVAAVDENGYVTVAGAEGSAKITAVITEGSREITAEIWITVTSGKSEPSLYTYAEREAAQENVSKYSWAWNMKEEAVNEADYYVEHLDLLYDMWIREGLPRNARVGYEYEDNYIYCRYCGTDLASIDGHYPWIVDVIGNPWKITCPICERDFPSNDFESYYKSGLDAQGYFHEELADEAYLVNELYPEMGEGWGVDDGWGYTDENGTATYIAYYVHCIFRPLGDCAPYAMTNILNTLTNAYLYTGDETYGSAGAILLNRMADIYPEYDLNQYDIAMWQGSDGGSGNGKLVGRIWEADDIGPALAKAADAFWPCMDNPDVIEYLKSRAAFKGVAPEEITPQYLRNEIDEDILLQIKNSCETQQMIGNFGMEQASMAYAAVALDRMPETKEMIEWIYAPSFLSGFGRESVNTGGGVMNYLVNLVDRDGMGDEVSYLYNSLLPVDLMGMAQALDGYDKVENADLWENQKFVAFTWSLFRLTVCGNMMTQVGEAGGVQSQGWPINFDTMVEAFVKTGNADIARAVYAANGNTAEGIHADIFTKDPETGIRNRIEAIIREEGEWNHNNSDMMAGFGIAILREGPERFLGKHENGHLYSDYWMYFGRTAGNGHEKSDALAIDLEAFGIGLSSTLGYPLVVSAGSYEREQWIRNTVSHNTVVVNDIGQSEMLWGGHPMHFADDDRAKIIDVDASDAYPETDIYRRTLVTVQAPNGVDYAVDFFRILGGSEHVYSFHGATMEDPATTGLTLMEQPMGTYAGPDIPYGTWNKYGHADINASRGSGYSWLDDVSRDADPESTFTVDWEIEDFHSRLSTTAGVHLKLHMLSEEPMTEVALANGHPPRNGDNPEHVEYLLARRSGMDGMDTLFTTVIEPYQHDSYIRAAQLVDVELTAGTQTAADRAAAMKITLESGRTDYVIYATNPNCTYLVDGKITFKGFAGVCSYEGGKLTYAWGSEVTELANVINEQLPAVTGSVLDFTKGLVLDGYTMTIAMDQPVTEQELTDRYVYVENNNSQRNAAYRIYGAVITGNTAVLDLHSQTLVRSYADDKDLSKGFVQNISVGDSLTIPLTHSFDQDSLLHFIEDQVVKTGYRMELQVGAAETSATYEADGLVKGMKFDAQTGKLTWTPSKTQVGRYPITVKAVNETGDVLATMEFVIYVVAYTGASYDASVCKHTKAITYTVDGIDETVCPACGLITKTEPVEEPIETIAIAGTNMNLGNELAVNFMFPKTLDASKSYTAIITQVSQGKTVKTTEVASSDWASFNNTLYKVTASVRAMEMADELSIRIVDEEGNVYNEAYTTSVRAYGMKALAAASSSDEMKRLVVDMLNYGS
ncbi:MAG: Ig-like domain-containing protein, partial [Oscillospiraceae bacterium]|nr:Ig-like domain-containing protein [Oscillospiraceae bacterium]